MKNHGTNNRFHRVDQRLNRRNEFHTDFKRSTSFPWRLCQGAYIVFLAVILVTHGTVYGRSEKIAGQREQVPGFGENVNYEGFFRTIINNDGQLAYGAQFGKGNDPRFDGTAIWVDGVVRYRTGDPAPGQGADVVLNRPILRSFNVTGQVAFEASIIDNRVTTALSSGWVDDILLLKTGDPTPGIANETFGIIEDIILNSTGQTAIVATRSDLRTAGIWSGDRLIALDNAQAPGTPLGTKASSPVFRTITSTEQVWYTDPSQDDPTERIPPWAIYRERDLIVRRGDQVPGAPDGTVFRRVTPLPWLANAVGNFAYSDREHVWVNNVVVDEIGRAIPELPGGFEVDDISLYGFNDRGQVLTGGITNMLPPGSSGQGLNALWLNQKLMVHDGVRAPGTADDVVFFQLGGGRFLIDGIGRIGLNDGGQVAFFSNLAGPGVTNDNDHGVWIVGPNGHAIPVARAGDLIDGEIAERVSPLLPDLIASQHAAGGFNNFSQLIYEIRTLSRNTRVLHLFTPDLHWLPPGSGDWDNAFNWTIGQAPGKVHDIFIDPDENLIVTGPVADVTVKSLTVGGGDGIGVLAVTGGTITSLEPVVVLPNGVITGNGMINASLNVVGQLSPGNSPGILHVTQDVTLESTSELIIELGGTTPGDQEDNHDQLIADGLLSLEGGTLNVVLFNGFTPSAGDVFDILDWTDLAGTFGDVLLPDLAEGLFWDQSDLLNTGELKVIPEPGTIAIVGALSGLVLLRRRWV